MQSHQSWQGAANNSPSVQSQLQLKQVMNHAETMESGGPVAYDEHEVIQRREVDVPGLGLIETTNFTERMLIKLIGKYLSKPGTFKAMEEVFAAIEAKEFAQEELGNEETEDPYEIPEIAVESEGSKQALALETLINEGMEEYPSVKAVVAGKAKTLVQYVKNLTELVQSSKDIQEIIQVYRLTGTDEFGPVKLNKTTKKASSQLIELLELKLSKLTPEALIKKCIPDSWGINSLIIECYENGEILDARHGANTSLAKAIDRGRLIQTMGELTLSLPILEKIRTISMEVDFIETNQQWAELILRILQGAVRRFKIISILELCHLFQQYEDEYLKYGRAEKPRITEKADFEVINAMRLAVQGEGHRAKEQQKMFLVLMQHLRSYPEDICIAYDPRGQKVNYDLAFESKEIFKVLEVETIPKKDRAKAYEFYKKKYKSKLESIKKEKNAVLFLVIPPLTRLPKAEIEKLKNDEDLLISNIHDIKSSD